MKQPKGNKPNDIKKMTDKITERHQEVRSREM